jgi:transcriptional regulator with XRE-family HTH domain
MTQAELARRLSCSESMVRRWEYGERRPTRGRFEVVCRVIGVDPESIVPIEKLARPKASRMNQHVERFNRKEHEKKTRREYGDELRAAVKSAGCTHRVVSEAAGIPFDTFESLLYGRHAPSFEHAQAIRNALNLPGLWPHVTEKTHMGRPKSRKRDEHRPAIERGSVWRRLGRTVKVERDAETSDVVYYRVLGKASSGELMQCAATVFLQRYAAA